MSGYNSDKKPSTPNEWADFWRYVIGVNVIPAVNLTKTPKVTWKEYQDAPIPQELHDEWKSKGMFDDGLASIMGKVFHNESLKDYWLNMVDCDNKLGIEQMTANIIELARGTLVEQSANHEKCHVYFYTTEPLKNRVLQNPTLDDLPKIEVKSRGRNLSYCAGGKHKNGSLIDIIDNRIPKRVDGFQLETSMAGIFAKYEPKKTILKASPTEHDMVNDLITRKEDSNRGDLLMKILFKQFSSISIDVLKKDDVLSFAKDLVAKMKYPIGDDRLVGCVDWVYDKRIEDGDIQLSYNQNKKEIDRMNILLKNNDDLEAQRKFQKEFPEIYESKRKSIYKVAKTDIHKETKNIAEEEYTDDDYMISLGDKIMDEYTFKTMTNHGHGDHEMRFYANGRYQVGGAEVIASRARKHWSSIKKAQVSEVVAYIQSLTGWHRPEEFDTKSNLINLKNVTFDLRTGLPRDLDTEHLTMIQVPVYYNQHAKCPRFDKFLHASLEGDEKKIRMVLEMIALCFIKDNFLLQKAFMNTGSGSNGKSVLFGIMYSMLGNENVSTKTIHDFDNNQFVGAGLDRKLANICADVGSKGITSTEALKKIIGGDSIECEYKFQMSYSFIPYADLIFSANDVPHVEDTSDGFARRFELIEWTKSFYGADRDHTVQTIKHDPEELSGIFNKLIPIFSYLFKHQKLMYESTVADARIAWLKKSDTVLRFIDDMCITNRKYFTAVSVLRNAYEKFCAENELNDVDNKDFIRRMVRHGCTNKGKKEDGDVYKAWFGICLKSEESKFLVSGDNNTMDSFKDE